MTDAIAALSNVSTIVLCLSATPPLIKEGRITKGEAGSCEVALQEPESAFQPGMHVVLHSGAEGTLRIMGTVSDTDGSRLRIQIKRIAHPDKRSFPRVYGGIHIRYRVLSAIEEVAEAPAWLSGESRPGREGTWWEPDPFMDFSGSGLRFQDRLHCAVGDLLLLELHVAPSKESWHTTGRVVRVEPLDPDELEAVVAEERTQAPTHRIAVHFEGIPKEAREALTTFTLRIQDALLGLRTP